MSKTVTKTVSKTAAKTKAVPKSAIGDAMVASLTKGLTAAAATPVGDKKAQREAERAKRFPAQAKADAEALAAREAKAKGEVVAKPKKSILSGVAFVVKTMPKGKRPWALSEGGRPMGGVSLFAHTHAALNLLGMFKPERPAVSEVALRTLIGPTAVNYHLNKTRNFVAAGDQKVRLSADGIKKFGARPVDNGMANLFTDFFITGKLDASLRIDEGTKFETGIAL